MGGGGGVLIGRLFSIGRSMSIIEYKTHIHKTNPPSYSRCRRSTGEVDGVCHTLINKDTVWI